MVRMATAHDLATEWFGDGYTIERREFADGDTRTVIIHALGASATCYLQIQAWVGREEVWVEYFEDDIRRCREILPFDEFNPDADPWDYLW